MKKYILLLVLNFIVVLSFSSTSYAQQETKVGFTNIELLLAYYPATKSIEKEIETYRNQLSKNIIALSNQYQELMLTYNEKLQKKQFETGEEEELVKKVKDLEIKIQKATADAEQKISEKQSQLLQPVMEEFQSKINEIAKEDNYTYILNQTSGTNLLYGLEMYDITEKLAKKLNITLPK